MDHLVWLRWGQKRAGTLNIRYGVLHREGTAFAEKMLETLGYPLGQRTSTEKRAGLITFEMADICAWQSGLMSPEIDGVEHCVQKLTDGLTKKVRPQFERIIDDLTMYQFLAQVPGIDFWPPIGATRAAEVIYIGKSLEYSKEKVFRDLELFRASVAAQLGSTITVDDYVALAWSKA